MASTRIVGQGLPPSIGQDGWDDRKVMDFWVWKKVENVGDQLDVKQNIEQNDLFETKPI